MILKALFIISVALVGLISACKAEEDHEQLGIRIPGQSDWVDRGIALLPGSPRSWDVKLEGAISPAAVVKKDGTYFLYYIGADGARSTDGGPRHRALGVATSTDGIYYEKVNIWFTYCLTKDGNAIKVRTVSVVRNNEMICLISALI